MDNFQNSNNNSEYQLNTTNTFIIEPTLESELKKLLENKNKAKDIKLDKISFLSKNIQSIGNQIPLIFCNITRLYLSNNNITSLEGIEQFANLTHLSISYNLIEDIYELNRIINPEILLFLNVKGNFFCKNPSFVEVILNLFMNLKTLDDLKINNNHKKQIKYGQELSQLILPFLLDIDEKIEKISSMKNVYQLNQEYNLINSSTNSLQKNNNEELNNLIEEFNEVDENSINLILSLINEKKVLNNNNTFIPSLNELNSLINNYLNNSNNNLITSMDNKIKKLYETLFTNLILNQKRKDYRGFLNYLIMTSEQKLLEYIKSKGNSLKYIEMNKTSLNIICQNFEKILINNSDYTLDNINEIQMMIFYMYFNGNNILNNDENNVEIVFDEKKRKEKIVLNNYEKKIIDFREIIPSYFPIFPMDNEFMKNLINFIKEKLNTLNKSINEVKKMKININNININYDEKNNNDNMKNLYIIDSQIINNNDIVNINNKEINNEDNIKEKNINELVIYTNNNNNNEFKQKEMKNDNNYNLTQPLIYNSQNSFQNTNNNQEKKQTIESSKNIYIQESPENLNKYNQSRQNLNNQASPYFTNPNNLQDNSPNLDNITSFNNTSPIINPKMDQIQMKYNIIQYMKKINKIFYNQLFQKKYFFLENLKKIQYLSKIGQIFFTVQTTFYRLQLKYFFKNLIDMKKEKNNIYNNDIFNYPTNKYQYDLKYNNKEINDENTMNQKALYFYYHNLKKKIFMLFKFNFFCNNKNTNIYILNKNNNNNEENNDEQNNLEKYLNDENLLNSKVYNFFHGNGNEESSKKIELNDNGKIQAYNNSINLNEENKGQNIFISQNDNINDKNYNNALQLRKILEESKEEINNSNIDYIEDVNKKDSKNKVDELLNSLNKIYKELDNKCKSKNSSKKMSKSDINNTTNSFNKNKERQNKIKEIREKEREKARKKLNKNKKFDENKLLGVPNFLKNTYSSFSKNI